ncbi:MAG: LPS-assembly protein LptD [Arcobacteraceae bacterium]|nr:LPS-assembly protein LptD [Arcobacteraceae bacterium]
MSSNIYAKDENTIQIIANSIDTNGSIINASGDVLIFAPKYYITAKRIIFDKNNSTLELFDNVNISENNKTIVLTQYAFLDMKNDVNKATPILLIDKKSKIWINSTNIEKKSDIHLIKNATISSCECYNPDWSIGFTSGDYNTTDQWINTYNNTLYIKDLPAWCFLVPAIPFVNLSTLAVTYLIVNPPYIGFPINKERRSGLLKPTVGYGNNDGYFYMQPIYYAPRKDLDFEYIPQVRLLRGAGHELKLRYKDSEYSQLDISGGIFNEKTKYFNEQKLLNDEHYGWNLKYKRSSLFPSKNSTDGLLISLQNMNDIEYTNTRYKNKSLFPTKLLKSQIKYYYNTNSYYWNIDSQYYNDITQQNNDNVMQLLPQLQFHKYSTSTIFDKLTSSVDVKYDRKTRIEGIGAKSTKIDIPFKYNMYLFNKFLSLTFSEELHFTQTEYINTTDYDKGSLFINNHIISVDIDMLRPYKSMIHTIQFKTKFTKPNIVNSKGDLYGVNGEDSNISLFPIIKTKENIKFTMNQSFYNKKTLSAIINHKINQAISYDENGTSQLDDLENEITFFYKYGKLSNRLLYNHDAKLIIKSIYSLKFKKDNFFTNIDYSNFKSKPIYSLLSYEELQDTNSLINNESITGKIGSKVLKYYTISYKEQYDLIKEVSNVKEYGLTIDKKCWNLNLKLADNLVASATTTAKARRQNIVYATITLKPIVSFKQKYIQDEREE